MVGELEWESSQRQSQESLVTHSQEQEEKISLSGRALKGHLFNLSH